MTKTCKPDSENTPKDPVLEREGKKTGPKTARRGRKKADPAKTIEGKDGEVKIKRGRGRPCSNTIPIDPNDPNVHCNAARERSRVKTLRDAFLDLQKSLPSVPPDTKLSKLDVLVLATTYIAHLMKSLDGAEEAGPNGEVTQIDQHQHRLKANGYLHPVKKWPMRSRLYAGALECAVNSSS
ncbi:transcription factor 23-like [Amphiura filiformis]|uniref:transcription factor 23-like n=1 Tax=Amphiura filiformis TaxID=82378 RepID=UPI003B21663B